jgi:hypothetical protein
LKALCQTELVKSLGWHTLTPILELHDVPTQFTTTSRLALIGNDWKTLNADVAALEDRGRRPQPSKRLRLRRRNPARWMPPRGYCVRAANR